MCTSISCCAVSCDGALDLQQRVFDQAAERDVLHLLAEPVEAAELVEQRAAPEELVGIAR